MLRFNSLSIGTISTALIILGTTLIFSERLNAASLRNPQILLGTSKDKKCSAKFHGQPNCSLQSVFNDITTSGTATDADNEQISLTLFELPSVKPKISVHLVAEVAGYSQYNVFGIYDPLNPSNLLPVFLGAHGSGARFILNIDANGTISDGSSSINLIGTQFGFYLKNSKTGITFYSEDSRNRGQTQSLIYQGKGQQLSSSQINPIFDAEDIILAFEDKKIGHKSDDDYNDFVVLVEGILPKPTASTVETTPEPTSVLGLGLISSVFAVFSRRNKPKT